MDRESESTPVLPRNAKIRNCEKWIKTKHSGYALVITPSISKPGARVCVRAFAQYEMPYPFRRCLICYAKLVRNCITRKTVAAARFVPFRFLVALKCGYSRKHNWIHPVKSLLAQVRRNRWSQSVEQIEYKCSNGARSTAIEKSPDLHHRWIHFRLAEYCSSFSISHVLVKFILLRILNSFTVK